MSSKLFQTQISQLSLDNPAYRKFVSELLNLFYKTDLGAGDITTALLKNPQQKMIAEITAKENGILAGLDEVEFFWKKHGVKILSRKKDGMKIKRGEVVAKISGNAEKVLTTERTALNLVQRMSGIATASAELAKKIGKWKFSATRKTPLGLLDSRAVVLGGGLPHRLNLADQILIKENHLAVDPDCWKQIKTNKYFEVEADSSKLALEIAKFLIKNPPFGKGGSGGILLLDNFTPAQLKKLVPKLRKISPKIILEASGGITPKNAKDFLKTGIDFVSIGKLTHGSPALDLSLKIKLN